MLFEIRFKIASALHVILLVERKFLYETECSTQNTCGAGYKIERSLEVNCKTVNGKIVSISLMVYENMYQNVAHIFLGIVLCNLIFIMIFPGVGTAGPVK